MPSSVSGFWSYTHRDNDNDGGRIIRLSELISREFETLTGEHLKIFVDKKDLPWGAEWKSSIDAALMETTFFISLITPLYLRSDQCRREFLYFMGKAESFGVKELLLPILYSTGPGFNIDSIDDDVLLQAKKIQWEDWRSLRLEDESSATHRAAVNKLAERLAKIVSDVSARSLPDSFTDEDGTSEDQPGFLEVIAKAEEAFPAWTQSMLSIASALTTVNELSTSTAEQARASDNSGGGASGKLRVILEFARQLANPAQEIYDLGTKFGVEISDINAGIMTLLNMAESEAISEEDAPQVESFFEVLIGLAEQSEQAREMLAGFAQTIQDMPNASRALRNPYRLISDGIQRMMDGLSLIESWRPKVNEIRQSAN
jgi:hypothetical protein